jgi:rhodanese-related sulfurtransferase
MVLLLGIVLLGVIVVFFFGNRPERGYTDVDASKAMDLISNGSVIVIDVREPYEFAAGHIPGAVLIPLGRFAGESASLDKNKQYLLVCRSGNRSAEAARFMVGQGFKHVYNLKGGMLSWTGQVER